MDAQKEGLVKSIGVSPAAAAERSEAADPYLSIPALPLFDMEING